MLLQSYAGFIEIMPAVPAAWKDISFTQLRAEGAFLIDARKENGIMTHVKIVAEKGGNTLLKLPFEKWKIISSKGVTVNDTGKGYLELHCAPGGDIVLGNQL